MEHGYRVYPNVPTRALEYAVWDQKSNTILKEFSRFEAAESFALRLYDEKGGSLVVEGMNGLYEFIGDDGIYAGQIGRPRRNERKTR